MDFSKTPHALNAQRTSSSVTNASWQDEMGASSDQLFFVTSYSNFDKLAHGPRGTRAKNSLYVYRFHPNDGSLVLLNIHGADVVNPAFSRYHPYLNVVYTCTEDIDENGLIYAYTICPDGELIPLGDGPVNAGGTSTCYLTIDKAAKFLLCVNYWDSTLGVIPLDPVTGAMTGPVQHKYDPKGGNRMVAAGRIHGGVNHSDNDFSTIQMRQVDPHSHALVLDPFLGVVAYVPDLGKDLIREFYYDRVLGKIETEINVMPSGLCTGHPDGPRYFEFHPTMNIAYVVNELSSTVAVFEVDRAVLNEIATASHRGEDMTKFRGRTTLRLIQSIKTVPTAFPTTMNTCGRMCAHRSGRFVVVSNRGHQSIAIFRVQRSGPSRGELSAVGYFHTRGETPRHFQFDASGQYLLVANQDSDSIAVFSFNLSTGVITYTGNEYGVPSPNFVCCCPPRDDGDKELEVERGALTSVQVSNMQVVQRAGLPHGSVTTTSSSSEVSVDDGLATNNAAKNNNKDEELEQARREIARLTSLLEDRHLRM